MLVTQKGKRVNQFDVVFQINVVHMGCLISVYFWASSQ